jgi:hypothetical protein
MPPPPASCTTIGTGNWSVLVWTGCSSSPPAATDVPEINTNAVTVDQTLSFPQIYINVGVLNGGSSTLNLSAAYPFTGAGVFNGQTGTVKLSDADHHLYGNHVYNNLIMSAITAPRTITIDAGQSITVNGTFISGSSATNKVTFAGPGTVANAVTSYYCASNGGITNITCNAGAPPASPVSAPMNPSFVGGLFVVLGIIAMTKLMQRNIAREFKNTVVQWLVLQPRKSQTHP